jgi:feruloyl-CoA synthase
MRLADPDDLSEGLVFDERVAEDFNLSTGIWVHAGGGTRRRPCGRGTVLQDTVVAGHDRDFVGAVIGDVEARRTRRHQGLMPSGTVSRASLTLL